MKFSDVIKKSVLEALNTGNQMDANSYIRICIYMCIALLVGAFICYIYKKCFFIYN